MGDTDVAGLGNTFSVAGVVVLGRLGAAGGLVLRWVDGQVADDFAAMIRGVGVSTTMVALRRRVDAIWMHVVGLGFASGDGDVVGSGILSSAGADGCAAVVALQQRLMG